METVSKKPDDLLKDIGRSIMTKATVYSTIIHIVLTAATSIALFKDWAYTETVEEKTGEGDAVVSRTVRPYLLKAPTYINAEKKKIAQAEAEKQRKLEAEKKAAEKAKAEAEAAAKAAEEAKKNPPKKGAPAAGTEAAAKDADGKVTPPEVEPLPPKKDFEYGDDLSLD